MVFNAVETKWNADDQKLHMLMEIEANLEEAFLDKNYIEIWNFLGGYRRQSITKFKENEKKEIDECFEELEKRYSKFLEDKNPFNFNKFYSYAEGLMINISQKLKEHGVYYREGRDARHAVLER